MQIFGPPDLDDDADGILDYHDYDHPSNIDESGDLDDLELENGDEEKEVTEKPKDLSFLGCKISIYSKTYNRGDSFTLEEENSDRNQTLEIKDLDTGNVKSLVLSRIDFHRIFIQIIKTRCITLKISFAVGFDNKLVSLQVSGGLNGTTSCCFGVYSEPDFKGDFLHFRFNPLNDGKYESASDMGQLFRAATSIQLLDESCTEPYDS